MIVKGSKINDRYQIIKTLGEGGMANVYLAHDEILDRNVAVKVLRGDLANDEKFVRRFQREALSASSLSHPNIVEMYDVGEDDGGYSIVMEYVDGKTLKQVLKQRGKLSVTEVVDIMLQVTDGMAHAHDSYIIHRDIKPQNIMILSNGVIKITDFGVATALNSTQLTQTNSVMGTVHYLPPEQANGKGSTIRSDIYSMGIMMYELLTGKVPYKGESAVEIALKHLKEPIPSIRKEIPSIPQSIENIILKACAKNPKNRYSDARSMHEDLLTALDPSRENEKRYVYLYPENDMDDTKVLDKDLEKIRKEKVEEEKKQLREMELEEKKENRKQNKLLIILISIFTALVLVTTVFLMIYFNKTEKKEVTIPDISNMSVEEASKLLSSKGLIVNSEYKYVVSETIEEGKVVKSAPSIGTSTMEGNTVILYISSGDKSYTIEDFTGENYLVAKGKIEAKCDCNVTVEKEKVSEKDKKKEDTVLRTVPDAGSSVKLGTGITIYIPEIEYKYPNFTKGYTLDKIKQYCSDHEIKLEVVEQTTDSVPAGTILKQSRPEGSVVTSGVKLTITVAIAPVIEDDNESGDITEGN